MFNKISFALFLLSVALVNSIFHYKPPNPADFPPPTYNQVEYWFTEQLLDHFDVQDNRTWSQRYWVVDNYYNPENGPVFLYICGEYTCPGVNPERLFPVLVAEEMKALIVVLEHRYYGLSAPLGDQSFITQNMEYLTVEQALADLAYFLEWVKNNNTEYQIGANSPWIALGGSYPGALSAWFRLKYPNLVIGSWASSAVINSILNFSNFDYQVYLSTSKSGPACPAAIQQITNYCEQNLFNNGSKWAQQFKGIFGPNAEQLTDVEFLWYIADTLAEAVQYGGRIPLCEMFAQNEDNVENLFNATAQYIIANNNPEAYGAYFLSNDTWSTNNEGGRQWTYQVCSQLGWFQGPGPYPQYAMRSPLINLTFYQQFCENVFGIPLWPNVELVNNEFGGANIEGSKILLINGDEDPWQWASNTGLHTADVTSYYVVCPDCGHCVELYTPQINDSLNLQAIRIDIVENITNWINGANMRHMLDLQQCLFQYGLFL